MRLKRILLMGLSMILIGVISVVSYAFMQQPIVYQDQVFTPSVAPIPAALQSNRYTQMDDESIVTSNPYTSLDGHELVGVEPTNNLALYVHPEHLSLRVLNQETGYIWASNMDYGYRLPDHPNYHPDDIGSDYYLNEDYDIERDIFVREEQSPVQITYYNTASTNNQRFIEYFFENTQNGTFSREALTDTIGFKARMRMPISGIRFDLHVYLDEKGLHVEVPFDSVTDHGNFVIGTITLYRYFGFTKDDFTPGYVFIPDGVGALIRYDSENMQPFSKKYYGPDLTFGEQTVEQRLTAAVFGMVHGVNQHGMLGIIHSGAGNATLGYVPADHQQTDFNRMQVTFEYRNTYSQRLNASGTSRVERIQTEKNPFDIHLIYQFLSGDQAHYVGFANAYRKYLVDQGVSFNQLNMTEKIPLHLDVLATENRNVWYGKEVFTMTTAQQLKAMIETLKKAGVGHLDIGILGWQEGGDGLTSPHFAKQEPKFGSLWHLNELEAVDIFYGMSPLIAYQNALGYHSHQVAQNQGSELILLPNLDGYLIKIDEGYTNYQAYVDAMKKQGLKNVSLLDLGWMLYSDYGDGIKSRSSYIEIAQAYLDIAEKTSIEQPFDYLWGADVISDVTMYSSQQLKFTDTVPFIPIVLSGYKHVYGRSGNFFANTTNELLRMVDYHVFPNFLLTHESAHLLLHTASSYIFTSRFFDWQDEVIRQYNYVNDALKYVYHAQFESRQVMMPGVVKNTYSNGVIIYVNYSGNDVVVDGIMIPGMTYEVMT